MAWYERIAAFISSGDFLWTATWVALGAVTVVLFGLMLTRWGRSEPLHRCVLLSVWLHALLATYAASVHVLVSRPAKMRDMMVHVVAADDDGGPADAAAQHADAVDNIKPRPVVAPVEPPIDPAPEPTPKPPPVVAAEPSPTPPPTDVAPPEPEPPPAAVATTSPPEPAEEPTVATPPKVEPPAATQPEAVATTTEAPPPPTDAVVANDIKPQPVVAPVEPVITPPLVPIVPHDPPAIYAMREADHVAVAKAHGGSVETEAAVKAALVWLSKMQSPDGRWDASQFGAGQEPITAGQNRRGAGARADTGITGLALLAFLGSGHTHQRGDYQSTVARGLNFLIGSQGRQGQLGGDADVYAAMYCHGMATLAMSEAYAMTSDDRLLKPVRDAISYTVNAQNQVLGGWRYRPGDAGDTSQLGWQLMALKSAEQGGIPISSATRQRMTRYLTAVSSGTHGGIASYRPGERPTRPMTAEALVCRTFLGIDETGRSSSEAAGFIVGELPGNTPMNLYYWYYATLGLYQTQGAAWDQWNAALVKALLAAQKQEGVESGSWDPDGIWGPHGGRVFATSLATMCLEVYYRYLPLYTETAKTDWVAR
jgi:hypothetical protein